MGDYSSCKKAKIAENLRTKRTNCIGSYRLKHNDLTGKTQWKEHQDGWAGGTQEARPEKTILGARTLVVKSICSPWLSGVELLQYFISRFYGCMQQDPPSRLIADGVKTHQTQSDHFFFFKNTTHPPSALENSESHQLFAGQAIYCCSLDAKYKGPDPSASQVNGWTTELSLKS